jgi:hypothetical protein
MRKALSIALLTLLSTGCAGTYEDTVRAKAANEFACPAPQISLKQASPDTQIRTFAVEGCGKTETYDVNCGLLVCTAWKHEDAPQGGAVTNPAQGAPPASPEPSAPAMVSITMHNTCAQTVKMFLGKDPKFSSGTQTNMSSNEIRNFSMKVGDMLWIIDDSGNGMSNLTAGQGMTRMKILPSCSGFSPD